MAFFGGHCPLSGRLGGTAEEGWTASQHARMAADVAAAGRALPFAVLTITRASSAASEPVVVRYDSRCQSDADNAPVITGNNPDPIVITWPKAPVDELGNARSLQIATTRVTRHDDLGRPGITVTAPNAITIDPFNGGRFNFTVSVYATWGDPSRIEDYGGSPDKRDCETEAVPYAFAWYQELGASYGTAYGNQTSGAHHAQKLAHARALAAASRAEERARANCTPATSAWLLQDWADSLGVPVAGTDPEWLVRRRSETKLANGAGSDFVTLEAACQELLGDRFVSLVRIAGDSLSDPPTSTPPTPAWSSDFDLGNGVWASQRAHLQVIVDVPSNAKDPVFLDLVNVQLMRLLDDLAPAWATYEWTDTTGGGFYLDVSPLDFTGLS